MKTNVSFDFQTNMFLEASGPRDSRGGSRPRMSELTGGSQNRQSITERGRMFGGRASAMDRRRSTSRAGRASVAAPVTDRIARGFLKS